MPTWSARWSIVVVAIAAGGALVTVRGCDDAADAPPAAATPPAAVTPPRPAPRRVALQAARSDEPAEAAASSVGGDGSGTELKPADAVTLRVRVEDRRTGAPIAGARIDVDVVGDESADDATTGADGERLLLEPADLILRIAASAKGYAEASTSVRTGARGTSIGPVVLRLPPLGRLTGVVRGPDGLAVAGAFVVVAPAEATIYPNSPEQPWSRQQTYRALETFADTQGRYSADGLVTGRRYHAFARAEGSAWAPSTAIEGIVVSPDAPERAQDFALSAYGRLVVRLAAADGTPAAPTIVTVSYGNVVASMRPDSSGTYFVDRLQPGIVTVSCAAAGFAVRDVVIPSGETAELTLDPRTITTIRGVVVDDEGRAVPGAAVQVHGTRRTSFGEARLGPVQADAQGAFVVMPLTSATCAISATAPGHVASGRLDVQAPADGIRIVLRRAAVLTFRPTPNARSWPGKMTYVTFDVRLGDGGFAGGVSDVNDGEVIVDCEPVGETRVRIYSSGLAPAVRRATLTAGTVTDLGEILFAEPRPVRVHVADPAGHAVAHALVEPDDSGWRPPGEHTPSTDADGNASYPWAPPSGPLPLRIRAPGFLDLRTIADVGGDAPVALTLNRGGLLWGEVLGVDGVPSPDTDVRVVDARGADVARVTADRHGQFDVRIAPGRYTVRAGDGPAVSVELTEGRDEHVQLAAPPR